MFACVVGGAIGGAICVLATIHYNRKKQAKRLADAQINPEFRFQDTHDPSGTAGGIPASNPIPDEALETDTDNPIATERALMDSPDPRAKKVLNKQQSTDPMVANRV